MEIRRGKKEEFYTLIDFIDFVFSRAHCPHDFLNMYVNLYHETDESMYNMINIWDGDMVVGSALSLPRKMVIGSKTLTVNGIGSVACHPRMGGKGIMSKLMKYNNEEMRKNGVQMAYLGGRRYRYNHFGYEIGGTNYNLEVSDSQLEYFLPKINKDAYSFVSFTMQDTEILSKCHALYSEKPIHYDYTDLEFYERLTIPCAGAVPYVIYNKDGDFCGYISHTDEEDISIVELCLVDDNETSDVLLALAAQKNRGIRTDLYEYQIPYYRPLTKIGSLMSVDDCAMWQILDWKAVIEATLSFKASYMALPEGTLVIGIGDETYRITLRDKQATAELTDAAPDFSFDALEGVSALTAPTTEVWFGMQGDFEKLSLAKFWFPLPLSKLHAERV